MKEFLGLGKKLNVRRTTILFEMCVIRFSALVFGPSAQHATSSKPCGHRHSNPGSNNNAATPVAGPHRANPVRVATGTETQADSNSDASCRNGRRRHSPDQYRSRPASRARD